MKSKALSLELIQALLDNAGPVLQSSEKFITGAIKKHLCYSLLVNGVSSVPRVFQATLSIFSTLLNKFKDHLKARL
jgi:Sec7-like guanine-nucleotide exchange factor